MADVQSNISKGRAMRYFDLPEANDAAGILVLQSAGIEADATLIDYDDIATMLAASNNEMTFTGYARKTLSGVTVTVDDTNNRVEVDAADPTSYTNSSAQQASAKAVIYYDSDTTAGTDANLVPIYYLDAALTFDVGVPLTITFGANGFGRAS